jgi:hypothetical protein
MTPDSPLPLREAIRRYWLYLIPAPLFAPLVCYLFRFTHDAGWIIPIFAVLFFATATCTAWPMLFYRAPRSFWNLGGLLYVVGGTLLYGICELLLRLIRGSF